MSSSDRAGWLALPVVVLSLFALPASAQVSTPEAPAPDCGTAAGPACGGDADHANAVGLSLLVGGATITSPNDDTGDITLLYGSAFTGPAFRGALTYSRQLTPSLALGGEVGFGAYRMQGHAERGSYRRELDFRLSSIDVLLAPGLRRAGGKVGGIATLLVGGRFGVSASATERRTGFSSDEGAPAIRTGSGFLLGGELGAFFRFGRWEVPVTFRALRNVTYRNTTEKRLDGYVNPALPGDFTVEASWTYGLTLGAAYRF